MSVGHRLRNLGLAHELLGQALYVHRHGGGEQVGAAILRQHAVDALHVRVEAHGQEFVGFVQHQIPDGIQLEVSVDDMVEQAAGGSHHDLHAALERVQLRAVGHAAVDGHGRDAHGVAELDDFLIDLQGQFARGRHDEHLRGLVGLFDHFQQRQHEGAGLAGPGLGLDDDVLGVEDVRGSLLLHQHQIAPAVPADHGLQRRRELVEGQIRKRVGGFDDADGGLEVGGRLILGGRRRSVGLGSLGLRRGRTGCRFLGLVAAHPIEPFLLKSESWKSVTN